MVDFDSYIAAYYSQHHSKSDFSVRVLKELFEVENFNSFAVLKMRDHDIFCGFGYYTTA